MKTVQCQMSRFCERRLTSVSQYPLVRIFGFYQQDISNSEMIEALRTKLGNTRFWLFLNFLMHFIPAESKCEQRCLERKPLSRSIFTIFIKCLALYFWCLWRIPHFSNANEMTTLLHLSTQLRKSSRVAAQGMWNRCMRLCAIKCNLS